MKRLFVAMGFSISFLAPMVGEATERDARELSEKFLAHMHANAPVAGSFHISTVPDPVSQEAFRKAALENATMKGQTVSFEADKPELNCRWAWDGSRELLETLSGSNVWTTFFSTPEGNLQGMEKGNFNLDKPRTSPIWRPASFYFLGGAARWSEILKECELGIEDAPPGVPAGCVTLVAKSQKRAVYLVLNKAKGTLHGYRMLLPDGKPYIELKIEKLQESSEGQVFPASAHLVIFQPATGRVEATKVLSAREISFPSSKTDVENAFRLMLPVGTIINDLLLSEQIKLKSPALATDVLTGTIHGTPVEFKTTPALTGTQSAATSDYRFWWGFALVTSLPLAIYLAYRGYKLWRVYDSPN